MSTTLKHRETVEAALIDEGGHVLCVGKAIGRSRSEDIVTFQASPPATLTDHVIEHAHFVTIRSARYGFAERETHPENAALDLHDLTEVEPAD